MASARAKGMPIERHAHVAHKCRSVICSADMGRTTEEVLLSARRVLENALQGQADFLAAGDRRLSGMYNAVTSGRSVTWVLQNLRTPVEDFDDWYSPIQKRLEEDRVARYFHELRTRMEKRGDHGRTAATIHVRHLDSSQLWRNAPPNTRSVFIGDNLGRSGWNVLLPDGSSTVIYFELPTEVGTVALNLEGAPAGKDFATLLNEWLTTIEQIYIEAATRFAPGATELLHIDHPSHPTPSPWTSAFDAQTLAEIDNAIRKSGYAP